MTAGGADNVDSPVEQALAGGTPERVGWYRFYFADERWEWSPEVEGPSADAQATTCPAAPATPPAPTPES